MKRYVAFLRGINVGGKNSVSIKSLMELFSSSYYDVSLALGSPDSRYEKVFNYKDKVFWSFDLNNYRKSVWWKKSASSSVSGFITIRTANTVRKVLEICKR